MQAAGSAAKRPAIVDNRPQPDPPGSRRPATAGSVGASRLGAGAGEPQALDQPADLQLAQIASVIGIPLTIVHQGRLAMTGLGDPLRHALLARIAKAPQAVGCVVLGELGANRSDVSYRLSCMVRDKVLRRGGQRTYSVNPDALLPVRQYVDLLITASAWSSGRSSDAA